MTKVSLRGRRIRVEGPRGSLDRDFSHALVTLTKGRDKKGRNVVTVEKRMSRKKKCSVVKTIAGHINNMFVGVCKGYRYKMKLVYAHFPINATVKDGGDLVELRNYIGQKHVHRIAMPKGVKCVEPEAKDEYWLEGNDLEDVSHAGMSTVRSNAIEIAIDFFFFF